MGAGLLIVGKLATPLFGAERVELPLCCTDLVSEKGNCAGEMPGGEEAPGRHYSGKELVILKRCQYTLYIAQLR